MTQQLPSNTFTTAKWIVSATASDGTHTTIQAAINSASSGDTIFIRPGTYTENLTLKAGVNLVSYETDSLTPNVAIVGKSTFTTAGTVVFSGINIRTNGDFFLDISGSAASSVVYTTCFVNALNNTGISFTSSSASASILFQFCEINVGLAGVTLFTATSPGNISLQYCDIINAGGSTTASSTSASNLDMRYCRCFIPIQTTGTGLINLTYCSFGGLANITPVTHGGTTPSNIKFCSLDGGNQPALSIGGTLSSIENSVIKSTNTNAITGAGSVSYQSLTFTNSNVVNTTTATQVCPQFMYGTGDPNGTFKATQGSYYARIDGSSASTRGYVNTDGGTTWTNIVTAA